MNCPDCGTQIVADQRFCRECGANLWSEKKNSGVPSPVIGILLAFGGIILALAGRMLFNESAIIFIGVVTSLIGMMSLAIIPLSAAKMEQERRRTISSRPVSLAPAEPTTKLPPMSARDTSIPSVVEDTTDLLEQPLSNQIRR
jgi:hypothetical protein